MFENPRGERRSFSRRKLIGANGYGPVDESGSGGGMGVGATLAIVVLLVAAVAFMISTIVLAAETHNPPPPRVFTPLTVPKNVNDFYAEYFTRIYLQNNTQPTADEYGCKVKGNFCYGKRDRSIVSQVVHLDDPDSNNLKKLHEEFRARHRQLLNTNQMSNAQKDVIVQQFGRDLFDTWVNGLPGTTPQECIDIEEALSYMYVFLWVDFSPWFPNYEVLILDNENDGTLPHDHPFSYPIVDDESFEHVLGTIYRFIDRLKRVREENFYLRAGNYMQSKYGVGYSTFYALTELTILDIGWIFDSSALTGGPGSSSVAEFTIWLRALQSGYAFDVSELQTAIIAADNELQTFIPWAINQFTTVVPMFDDVSGCPSGLIPGNQPCHLILYHGAIRSNNPTLDAACSPRKLLDNQIIPDGDAYANRLKSNWLSDRQIAEDWLTANAGDYLGWNMTWVHVFFGTEANVTELGWHPSTDCPTDTADDPFYSQMRAANIEGSGAVRRFLGAAASGVVEDQNIGSTDFFGGCDADFGNAFAAGQIPYKNTGTPVVSVISPLQPKGAEWSIMNHENHHVQQWAYSLSSCPDCSFYHDLTYLFDGRTVPENIFQSVEGSATYQERYIMEEETRMLEPADGFRNAIFRLQQISFRFAFDWPAIAPMAGLETPETAATFVQENEWYPWSTWERIRDLSRAYSTRLIHRDPFFSYSAGAHRYYRLDQRIRAECPNVPDAPKRVRDITILLPGAPTSSHEIAIDEYIKSGCTHFPYEIRY